MAPAVLALALLHAPAAHAAPRARELRVFAAASLADAFTDLGRIAERRQPGLTVTFNFAGSQQLATQLEQGADADVFASADGGWMDRTARRGLVAGTPVAFAANRLVVIVPRSPAPRVARLQDLAHRGVKLVIGARAVPVGRYGRTLLANLAASPGFGADFAARALANVVSEEENVRAVVAKVQLGEADAGIVYRSDVTPAVAPRVRALEVPELANVTASYPIATLARSREAGAARAFVDLVLSREGQRVLAAHGFLPVAPVSR